MVRTVLLTSCKVSDIRSTASWVKRQAEWLRERSHVVEISLLVSEGDIIETDDLGYLSDLGIDLLKDQDWCESDHRPRIERVFEEIRSRTDSTTVVITNSDLHWGETFKEQLSTLLGSEDFGVACWHRMEKCNGVLKGNYMYGVDVVAIDSKSMPKRKINQFFRFGKVGWDYAVTLASNCARQRYYMATDLIHECHESGHSRHEWSCCIAELVEYTDVDNEKSLKHILEKIASTGYYPAKVVFEWIIARKMRQMGWKLGRRPIEI